MIAKISNPITSDFSGMINYHEQKCEKGVAKLIDHNLVCSRNNFPGELTDISAQNTRITNKGFDISFNFHYEDKITDDEFLNLKDLYVEKMGWTNPGEVIYKHEDKDHQHYHMVITSVNMDGNRNKELDWYYKLKSKNICRELEKEFGLKQLQNKTYNKENRLIEKNISTYTIYKSINKAVTSGDKKTLDFIEKHKTFFEGKKVYTNDTILNNTSKKDVDTLMQHLSNSGFQYKTEKSQLFEKLDTIRKESTSRADYIKAINNTEELYVRDLQNTSGKRYLKYVYQGKDYSSDKLPFRFKRESFDHINLGYHDKGKQKQFLFQRVSSEVKKSKSIEELITRLEKYNIKTTVNKNSSGIKGLSFTSLNSLNSHTFKASELSRNLSFNKINQVLDSNNIKQIKESPQKASGKKPIGKNQTALSTNDIAPAKSTQDDQADDFMIGKQKENGIDNIQL